MKSKAAYPWFYFLRVARLSLVIFVPTFIFILFLYRSSYKEGLIDQTTLQAKQDLENVEQMLKMGKIDPIKWCQQTTQQESVRYSLIQPNGTIVCDTDTSKLNLTVEDAGEVQAALKDGYASNVRYSSFFKTTSVFSARKLSEQFILRKVIPITALKANLSRFDKQLFTLIIPFAVFSYLLFLALFYHATKPLGVILSRVEKFQVDLPFKKTLQQLYQKDKWAQIEAALNETDLKLQDQVNQVKLENEKIGTILESIFDDIIAIDPFETILFYNSNFQANFIRGRKIGEILPKLWHIFEDQDIQEGFRSVLKSGASVSLKGMNLIPNRYFDLTVTPLKDVSGSIIGALGVFYDVTDFKLTEQMRVDFVANVSHEIRTPLTSIKGFAQVLQSQRDKLPEELGPFLDKILNNTERMISLFNDLLNLSVIESKFQLRPETLSLPEMVDEISESVKANYPKKKIRIQTDFKLENIKGDQRLMEQVITNLIDNACKYSGDELTIRVTSSEENKHARIEVADNGPGIAPEHLSRIFERFYRIEASREVSRGTGLGLSIVKHIVARHGGIIRAERGPLGGASFIVELPLE